MSAYFSWDFSGTTPKGNLTNGTIEYISYRIQRNILELLEENKRQIQAKKKTDLEKNGNRKFKQLQSSFICAKEESFRQWEQKKTNVM